MSQVAALKVVGRAPFYRREVEFWSDDSENQGHSLHYGFAYPDRTSPDFVRYFVDKFSNQGQVVLDPFCGIGTVGLEAALMGRIPYCNELNPVAARVAEARLFPADISEVTLQLQLLPLQRPVDARLHDERFEPFYDLRTFCELSNLRSALRGKRDRVSAFIEMITLSLLHGHSAGFFSTYTFPQVSLAPAEQVKLNLKRRQLPDYRAVLPRILRKAATVLRDGVPSVLGRASAKGGVICGDARNLSKIPANSVDLVVTSPPLLSGADIAKDWWLKLWFMGYSPDKLVQLSNNFDDLEAWLVFMNESLLELARVTKSGARAVLELKDEKSGNQTFALDEELQAMVEQEMSRFWEVEGILIQKLKPESIRNCLKPREDSKRAQVSKALILKRR